MVDPHTTVNSLFQWSRACVLLVLFFMLNRRRKMSTSFWGETKRKRADQRANPPCISHLQNQFRSCRHQRRQFSTVSPCQVLARNHCKVVTRWKAKRRLLPLLDPRILSSFLIGHLHVPSRITWWGTGFLDICQCQRKAMMPISYPRMTAKLNCVKMLTF